MRPGPARGESTTLEVTVEASMAARVGRALNHELYGTAALVEHVEQVSRSLLEPHLEEGEEGVGYRIDVTHRAPVPIGAHLNFTATVAEVGPQRLVCEVVVRLDGQQVARGTFEQRVVDVAAFRERIPDVTA